MKLGITGGICCGKSTVLEIFGRYGFDTINLDEYVRDALRGNERIKLGVKSRFGDSVVDENGEILVKQLANMVFSQDSARKVLENLIHSEIDSLWTRNVTTPTAIEVPLLFEGNLERHFDATICVYSTYPEQLSRSMVFRHWDEEELRRRTDA
ncbi:MAG: dephospho-CoA kinase, partial [Puniceicoccales bacterium]|nr:dephospho-CoA kinase [Puniceicoccales bacterium]